ncbi:MAG: SDR family NAD(P)-dependent oxidoreductase [Patescibacteria group bacterium]|nr:SDR family oxidoreductase [Patescibacteria group bacterium]
MKLKDKVALITGSSRGIGRATAILFAKEGAKVVINCKENVEKAEEVLEKVGKGNGIVVKADVSTEKGVKRLISETEKQFGRIDILVANAGVVPDPCGIEDSTEESINQVIDTNLKGTYKTLKIIGERLSKGGSVVTVSSVDGIIGEPFAAMYSATKAGIIALTKAFARHYSSKQIRVNCVAPGLIETDLTKDADEQLLQETLKGVLIPRIGRPEEVANAILFFASSNASYMTGATICVDGGFNLK